MNDQRIEEALRATLHARADTVTRAPAWDATDELVATRGRRSRGRWIAPLAATAVVLVVVGGVLAVRGGRDSSRGPAAVPQADIPSGMKAVDALGVEVFVPKSYIEDDTCRGGPAVIRPLPSTLPCPALQQGDQAVAIAAPAPNVVANARCDHPIVLGGERGCAVGSASTGTPDRTGPVSWTVIWPRHQVRVTAANLPDSVAMKILRSAHAVSVDRNGCAARNASLQPAPTKSSVTNIPGPADITFDSELLPESPTRNLSVCWYIDHRLVASDLLGRGAARSVIGVANGMPPMWPGPTPRPTLPSCDSLAATDGVLLIAHAPGRADVTAVANFAACNGQRTTRSATAAYLTEPALATTLARTTGIPISLDYPAMR